MAEFIKGGTEQPQKFVFDPKKNYKWEPDDKFILTGVEFGTILTALQGYKKDEDFIKVSNTLRALEVAEKIFITAVEAGIAKEIDAPPQIDDTMYS